MAYPIDPSTAFTNGRPHRAERRTDGSMAFYDSANKFLYAQPAPMSASEAGARDGKEASDYIAARDSVLHNSPSFAPAKPASPSSMVSAH